jgi:hypothetical protein
VFLLRFGMEVFEIIIGLLLGGAILAAVARRIATPYPRHRWRAQVRH